MIENYEEIRTSIKDNEFKNNSNEDYDRQKGLLWVALVG